MLWTTRPDGAYPLSCCVVSRSFAVCPAYICRRRFTSSRDPARHFAAHISDTSGPPRKTGVRSRERAIFGDREHEAIDRLVETELDEATPFSC
jgi:hypothetical protein